MELEINEEIGKVIEIGNKGTINIPNTESKILLSPMVGEDYWVFRVKLTDKQSILGFPKFMTMGIGFAKETDWNTNLPYTCETEYIYNHIEHNKGDKTITKKDVIAAIKLIQAAAEKYKDAWKCG